MESELSGRVIVITGASGGIGSAIAKAFASEGARLVLHYRSNSKGIRRLQRDLGAESISVRADLTREAEARALFGRAQKAFGRVDSVVANAGAWESRDVPLHAMSLKQWRSTLDAVLTSVFLTLREFLKIVAKQGRGNAVLIASTAGVFGEAGHADYASAKAALAYGLTRTLKNEIARIAPHTAHYCGGRVNCVCPGWTVVPRTQKKLTHEKTLKKVMATMALPQIARPDDIANAVVFLSSDRLARHITGQTILIAGGMEGRVLWQPDEIETNAALGG
jgi:3-oxoacyl-[acyl-carrier protein] reductase